MHALASTCSPTYILLCNLAHCDSKQRLTTTEWVTRDLKPQGVERADLNGTDERVGALRSLSEVQIMFLGVGVQHSHAVHSNKHALQNGTVVNRSMLMCLASFGHAD